MKSTVKKIRCLVRRRKNIKKGTKELIILTPENHERTGKYFQIFYYSCTESGTRIESGHYDKKNARGFFRLNNEEKEFFKNIIKNYLKYDSILWGAVPVAVY